MSTKIYNAFKFDKFYSLSELSKMIDNTRKAVQEKQRAMYFHKLLYQFNFYYNMYLLQEMCEKPAPLGVGWIAQIMCM